MLIRKFDTNVLSNQFDKNKFISLEENPREFIFDNEGQLISFNCYKYANHPNRSWWGTLKDGELTVFSRSQLLNPYCPGTGLSLMYVAHYMLSFLDYSAVTKLTFPADVAGIMLDKNLPNVKRIVLQDCGRLSGNLQLILNKVLSNFTKLKTLQIEMTSQTPSITFMDQLNDVDYSKLPSGLTIEVGFERKLINKEVSKLYQTLRQAIDKSINEGALQNTPPNAKLHMIIDTPDSNNNCSCCFCSLAIGSLLLGIISLGTLHFALS